MKTSRIVAIVFLLASTGVAMVACQNVQSVTTETSKKTSATLGTVDYTSSLSQEEKAKVVATIDGVPITMAELYNEIGGSLFKLRTDMANKEHGIKQGGLDSLIENRLLEKEAKRRGVSVEQLLKDEVESKLADPSDEDLKTLFNQYRRRFPPTMTFEKAKSRLKGIWSGREKAKVRSEFLATLREKAKVETMLPFPDLPSMNVSMDDDPVKGNKDAPVKIIEFSDYQCPYCKRNVSIMDKILETYGDKVAIVFRDFPLAFHDKAQKAAEAAECADDQGKFWEYHDELFADQKKLDPDSLKETAKRLGLKSSQFNACLDSGKYEDEVKNDLADGQLAGVTGTPAAFVNGKMVNGARPFEAYQGIINGELAKLGLEIPKQ